MALELFSGTELRALLAKSGYYGIASGETMDLYAIPARLGLGPHPALEHLEAVRFIPENAFVGSAGYFLIGVSETEKAYCCPPEIPYISF